MVYSVQSYLDMLSDAGLVRESRINTPAAAVEEITYDSKAANAATLFVCKGAAFRAEYLQEAVSRGALCYVSEAIYSSDCDYIIVNDIRRAMALIADARYDSAYNKLKLAGITGTKGKTTTAYYIKYILDEYAQSCMQKPTALLSSIEVYDGTAPEKAQLTTPEAFELHRRFDNAVTAGLSHCVMEVSSQALKYDRVYGVDYDIGVFLNMGVDHISDSEHSDFEDYCSSKLKLFSQCKTAVVNADTDYVERIFDAASQCSEVISFGVEHTADVCASEICKLGSATSFRVHSNRFALDDKFVLTMPGRFNVDNALAAITVALCWGVPIEHIKTGLRKAKVMGRLEIYESVNRDIVAIVDYAHNAMSFQKVFEAMMAEFPNREVVVVFGSTGDKATNRREDLGKIADRFADRIYLTADDPGNEQVEDICRDIAQYIKRAEYHIIPERERAIRQAVADCRGDTLLLLLGKGGETTQKAGATTISIKSDAEVITSTFTERKDYAVF